MWREAMAIVGIVYVCVCVLNQPARAGGHFGGQDAPVDRIVGPVSETSLSRVICHSWEEMEVCEVTIFAVEFERSVPFVGFAEGESDEHFLLISLISRMTNTIGISESRIQLGNKYKMQDQLT